MDYTLVVFDSLISATALIAPRPGRVHRYVARFSDSRYVDIVVQETAFSAPVEDLLAAIPVPGSAVIVEGTHAEAVAAARPNALHAMVQLTSGETLR